MYNCEISSGKVYYKLTKKQRLQAVWTAAINNTWAASWLQTSHFKEMFCPHQQCSLNAKNFVNCVESYYKSYMCNKPPNLSLVFLLEGLNFLTLTSQKADHIVPQLATAGVCQC